jgi:hypothetical protein
LETDFATKSVSTPSQEPEMPKVSNRSTAIKARRGKGSSSFYRVRNWAAYDQALKQRPDLGYFWNGCHGRAEKGLEVSTFSLIDLEHHTGYALSVQQTPAPTHRRRDAHRCLSGASAYGGTDAAP